MIVGRERGWLYSGKSPAFFVGQAGCWCCSSVSHAYHTFVGNKTGGVDLQRTDKWDGSWTAKTNCPSPGRIYASGFELTDRTHICGGFSATSPFDLPNNDGYTPDAWTSYTNIPSPSRFQHAGLTIDTTGYIWGGDSTFGSVRLADNDSYDGAGDSWTGKTDMGTATDYFGAAQASSKGYAYYGRTSVNVRTTNEYDPAGNSWAAKTSGPTPTRNGLYSYAISSKCYAVAGSLGTDNDEYDPSGDSWTSKTDIVSPARQWGGSAAIEVSSVGWCTGGQSAGSTRMADHDEYTPDAWTNRTDLPADARQYNVGNPA